MKPDKWFAKIQTEEQAIQWIHKKALWNPQWFAEEIMGLKLTGQQKQACAELVKLMKAKIKVNDFLTDKEKYKTQYKAEPTEEELEYAKKLGISIRSGNGTGKDTWCAVLIPWFIFCFEGSKIIVTAPTQDQLRAILWAEVGKWMDERDAKGNYRFMLRDLYDSNVTYIYLKEKNKKGKITQNFAMARTATIRPDGESETLAGAHAPFMLAIVEEASGVPDAVFKPIERTMTGLCNLAILIFNPTRLTGYAADTHRGALRDKYLTMHWDARYSENVSPQHIQNIKDTYGEESNQYRISVLGEFPLVDENTLIPYDWALYALERQDDPESKIIIQENDPLVISCDVSRLGKNKSIILVKKGSVVIDIRTFDKTDTVECAYECEKVAFEYNEYDAIYVDTCGVGGGVYDILVRKLSRVYSVDVSKKCDEERFDRVRDKLWWATRDAFEKRRIAIGLGGNSIAKYKTEKLIRELSDMRLSENMLGNSEKIKIESKLAMKSRGINSPDYGDALMMTFFRDENFYRMQKNQKLDRYAEARRKQQLLERLSVKNSWMGC